MKKFFLLVFVATVWTAPMVLRAQVTIGSKAAPDNNALLDLKQDAETKKGLLLPRVLLTGTANAAPLTAHVAGMTVYNTATAGDVTPGYYYNDGAKWVRIGAAGSGNFWSLTGNAGTDPEKNYVGTSDDKDLVFKRNNILMGRITATGTGIKKTNPEATLHVGGNVKVDNMTAAQATDIPVAYNPVTKEITVRQGNIKPFYSLQYIINTGTGDWVENWDTKIDADKFTVLIVRADFTIATGDVNPSIALISSGSSPQRVFTSKAGGSWRLNCDFRGTSPVNKTTGVAYAWNITVLVINNTMVNVLGTVNGSAVQSNGGGSAPSNPIPQE